MKKRLASKKSQRKRNKNFNENFAKHLQLDDELFFVWKIHQIRLKVWNNYHKTLFKYFIDERIFPTVEMLWITINS